MYIDLKTLGSIGTMEIFYADSEMLIDWADQGIIDSSDIPCSSGYYFWPCFPCCIPDGDPTGPYPTYDLAYQALVELLESEGINHQGDSHEEF